MTNRLANLEQKKREIIERIRTLSTAKKEIIEKSHKLVSDYNSGKISASEYKLRLEKEFNKRTPQQWVNHYTEYIDIYENYLDECEERIKQEKRNPLIKTLIISVIIIGLLIAGLLIYAYIEKIPPVLAPPVTETHAQTLNLIIDEDGSYNWQLENPGQLQSVKISGSLEGLGEARVYLMNNNGDEWLILDSSNLEITNTKSITGLVVGEDNKSENKSIKKNDITNATESDTPVNITNITQEELPEENITELIEIPIKEFTDYCEQTCDFSEFNLTEESYTLRIEISNSILNLDTITYGIIPFVSPEEDKITKREEKTKRGKKVYVSVPEGLEGSSISTQIPETWNIKNPNSIKIYLEGAKRNIDFDFKDSNNNNIIDKIEWVVSESGNQTYNIIVITNAEHLDKKRDFIANIYEEVNQTDGITYTIPKHEYARSYFERNLTKENFIDIYVVNTESSRIEVYEQDSDNIIGEIEIGGQGEYYINLSFEGAQSVFDLKSAKGDVVYDYIHDAPPPKTGNLEEIFFTESINSLNEGEILTVTGNYENIGDRTGSWTIQLQSKDTNLATNNIDGTCIAGEGFRVVSINIDSCRGTCIPNPATGTVDLTFNKNRGGTITWTLETCSGSSNQDPYTITTIKVLGDQTSFTLYTNPISVNLVVNQAPVVSITSIDSDDFVDFLNPGSTQQIEIIFDVTDPDGYADINDSSVLIAFDYDGEGEPQRNIFNCPAPTNDLLNTKTYTCTVEMWYYDAAGVWNATVDVSDLSGPLTDQDTHPFQVNLLQYISLIPPTINFPTILPGDTNINSSQNTTIINEGNFDIPGDSSLQISSRDLVGETDSSQNISGDNFKASDISINVCQSGTQLFSGIATTIPGITLPKGSTLNPFPSTNVTYCLTSVPLGLSAQPYSARDTNAWDITILVAPLVIARRKKKKKKLLKKEKLLNFLDENIEDLLELVKQNKIKSKIQDIEIPLEIFKQKIGPAEALCKYLKENKNLKFNEISVAINRDQRTIWINYRNAIKKQKEKIKISKKVISAPIKIFSNRKLSILESLVKELKERGFTNSRIASLLGKNPNNIWTLYQRALEKLKR